MNDEVVEFSDEELEKAASLEEMERLYAENQHLKNRVVKLRALVGRLQSLVPEPEPVEVGEGVEPASESEPEAS